MSTTCTGSPRILIADDQPDLIDALGLMLKTEQIQMQAVTSPEAVLEALGRERFDLLLMDLNYTSDTTSGREGIDLLTRVQTIDSSLPVVVMTGWGSVDLAVEAMRRGVRDFVQKPWDNRQLIATLRAEIEEGRRRREQQEIERRDLDEARRIQERLLPAALAQIEGCALAGSWQPAGGVGGDCYDTVAFGPHRLGLCIADVVGKGIPAALLMSNLQATVRAFATDSVRPADLCGQINRILCGHIAEGRFISFVYCAIDTAARTLTYANAGHYPPLLVHADGTADQLTSGGAVLGVFPDSAYEQAEVPIRHGDRLVLYTDGISDALDAEGKEFGDDRLLEAALTHRACDAAELQEKLAAAVAGFSGGRFHDDATLIVAALS